MSDERQEDGKGPRTLAELLGLTAQRRQHQYTEGLFGALMAALGEVDEEAEERHRQEVAEGQAKFREAIDSGDAGLPMKLATLIVTRVDGKKVLVISSTIPPHVEGGIETALASMNEFLTEVVLPVLKPDERATVHIHDFDAEFLSQHALETIEGPVLAARFQASRDEEARQERIRKYCKCLGCDVSDCERRITEPPPGYVAPEPAPQP